MLSLLEKADYCFIDGTFRTAAKGYFQLLVLVVLHTETNMFVPVIYALATSKTQDIYETFFYLIQMLCLKNGIKIKLQKAVMDMEQGLQNAWNKIFPNIQIVSCFFHYVSFFFLITF